MRLIMCLVILLPPLPALAQVDIDLQRQLIKMAQQNQQISQSLDKYESARVPEALQSLALEISELHTETLKEIIALHGWPSKSQVEKQGIQAIFQLIQHTHDLMFQQDMLPLVIQSFVDKEGITGQEVAEFTDRILIKLGKKQVFGTQAKLINSKVIFAKIENENSVDQLRAQMDLPPLAEYKQTLKVFYGLQ